MRHVAIVGSRDYPDMDQVRFFVEGLHVGATDDIVVVSGGARGVDSVAIEQAEALRMNTMVIEADWSQGKLAGFTRNSEIVAVADLVVAFWDLRSKGTEDTIRKARRAGKKVLVFEPSW